MKKILAFLLFLATLPSAAQVTSVSGYRAGTLANIPGTCSDKQAYLATDATLGRNWYLCVSGAWKVQGGNSRIGTTTSSATPSIDVDLYDLYLVTALATDITSVGITGTPSNGRTLWVAITGTATRAITWGSSFESSDVPLPTTTSGTTRLDVGFVYNSVTSKYRCVASTAPVAGGGDALTSGTLAQFAATTSAQLAGVLSDEVGSGGGFLRATAPTMSAATVTGSLNVPHGTLASIPATCVQGDVYVATDQTAGLVSYACTATNTWTLVSPAGYPFSDANNLFFASGDATKLGKFDLSGLATGTTRTWTWPNASGTVTLLGNSSTGSGSVVLATSPTLVTPVLGVATATSINGTSIPSSKTLVVTTDTLAVLAATTSSQLAGVLSDEVGSGSAVFATKAQGPYLRGRIVSQTTDVTVANTTAETSIATGTLVGTNSIGAGTAYAGETISVYASGFFSTTGTPNLTFALKLGSTTVLTSTNATASSVSNAPFTMQATCTVRTTGATGTIICAWTYRGQGSSVTNSTQTTGYGTSTVLDFTGALAPDVTITWGTASASNTLTATQFYVERM